MLPTKKLIKALQVRALPGRFSNKGNLTLSYNITSYTPREMKI